MHDIYIRAKTERLATCGKLEGEKKSLDHAFFYYLDNRNIFENLLYFLFNSLRFRSIGSCAVKECISQTAAIWSDNWRIFQAAQHLCSL